MLRVLCLQLFIRLPIIKYCGTLLQYMLNPCQNGPFGVLLQNGQRFCSPLQCFLSSRSKNCKRWHQQNVNVSTLHRLHTQLNIFGFNFLDLLTNLMKMMLLYILYCPPPSQGYFNPWSSFHRSSLTPLRPQPTGMSTKIGADVAITSQFCSEILF